MKHPARHALLLSALSAALSACTGTDEPTTPDRLVVADGLRELLLVRVGADADPVTPISLPTTDNDVIVGLTAVASGRAFAVAFPNRVEIRSPEGVVSATLTPPASGAGSFTPCFAKLTANEAGSRLTVLNACPGAFLRVAQFDVRLDSAGGAGGELRWQQELSGLPVGTQEAANLRNPNFGTTTPNPSGVLLAMGGPDDDTVVVTRRVNANDVFGTTSDVFRARNADPDDTDAPRVSTAPISINDLASLGGNFYAATDGGTFLFNADAGTTGTTALVNVRATRLFARRGLLVSWDGPGASALVFGPATPATRTTLSGLSSLRDLTISLDNYLYALTSGDVIRYDLSLRTTTGTAERVSLNAVGPSVDDGRFITSVTP